MTPTETKKTAIEEKAEALYAYFDDLLARDLCLDGSVRSEDITAFAKQCAIKVCDEVIMACDQIKIRENDNLAADSEAKVWYQIKHTIETIRD